MSSSSPPPLYSHTRRTTSISSWGIIVLILVMPMMTRVPSATASNTIEHCLRTMLNPPPPPPPEEISNLRLDLGRIVCKDQFRIVGYYMRASRKLPSSYIEALCNIFDDDDKKVEDFITNTFIAYDPHRLMDDRTCATMKKKQDDTPPLS